MSDETKKFLIGLAVVMAAPFWLLFVAPYALLCVAFAGDLRDVGEWAIGEWRARR